VIGAITIGLAAISAVSAYRVRAARSETLAELSRKAVVQRLLLDLVEGDEAGLGPSKDLRVRTLLERAMAQGRGLASDPDLQSELYRTLGSTYQALGELDRADALLGDSLKIRERWWQPSDPRVIEARIDISLLRNSQSRFNEAKSLAADSLQQARARLGSNDPLSLKAQLALGMAMTGAGDYEGAISVLQAATNGFDRVQGAVSDASLARSELATAHQYAGHLDDAERLNADVLARDRQLRGPRHPAVAHDLLNMSDLANSRGKFDDAVRFASEAVAILEEWYGKEHPETGSARVSLSQPLIMLSRFDEAEKVLRDARNVFEAVYPGPHRRIGLVNNQLGVLATQRSRFDDALESFERALAIYRQIYPDGKSQYISVGLANLGSVYMAKGDWVHAEPLMRQAVTLSTEVLSASHMNTAIAQVKLGRVLVRTGRAAEAMPILEAGYATLMAQTDPASRWIQMAREEYAAGHALLHRVGDPADALRAHLHPP
jgi:serine/threonine-protein kinase